MSGKKITITVRLSNIQDKTKIKLIAYSPIHIFKEVAAKLSEKGKWNVKTASDISKIRIRNKEAHTEYHESTAEASLVKGDELLIETNVPWVKVKKQRWGSNSNWGRPSWDRSAGQWGWNWSRGHDIHHENIAVTHSLQLINHQSPAPHSFQF